MKYQSLNPATEEVFAEFDSHSDTVVGTKLESACKAFHVWRQAGFSQRAAVLQECARLLESGAAEYARMMATEMGKPLAEGESELKKCAWTCRHYAEHAEAMLANVPGRSDGTDAWVTYEPLGPILAIMPWNFPFWQLFRHAAPGLMAGNTILLKHAPNVPQCAKAIEDIFRRAGLPEGGVVNLFIDNDQVASLIGDERVAGVTLTGSTRAGSEVAALAGRALKKTVLELGGSDPFIVLPDADLDEAVRVGVTARCLNAGQSCIAAKRFLVHQDVYTEFEERFVEALRARVMGDPLDPSVNLGPQARHDLREQLDRQVRQSAAEGATVLVGGSVPAMRGFFYPATALRDVEPGMPVWNEEVFGPVAILIPWKDTQNMLTIANGTPYGLGASIWTTDNRNALALAPRLACGSVFINGMVKSDPRIPFGGIKHSGYGRELGREGILEFMNAKTIWVK